MFLSDTNLYDTEQSFLSLRGSIKIKPAGRAVGHDIARTHKNKKHLHKTRAPSFLMSPLLLAPPAPLCSLFTTRLARRNLRCDWLTDWLTDSRKDDKRPTIYPGYTHESDDDRINWWSGLLALPYPSKAKVAHALMTEVSDDARQDRRLPAYVTSSR